MQFQRALDHADLIPTAARAELEEAIAESLSTRDQWADAEPHWERAIELRRTLGDAADLSRCLRRYGVCLWRLCRTGESRVAQRESFELMRDHDDAVERGLAFFIRVVSQEVPIRERRLVLDECVRMARESGDQSVLGRAALAKASLDSASGVVDYVALEEALDRGLGAGDHTLAACAYTNLYEFSISALDLDSYSDRFDEALTYALEHEQHTYSVCLRGSRVTELLRRGQNEAAIDLALATMAEPISPVNEMQLRLGQTRAAYRLGRSEAPAWLDRLWSLARGNDEAFWLVQVATVAAEAAWLTGDDGLITEEVLEAHRRGGQTHPWVQGELVAWLRRLGRPLQEAVSVPAPYSLELDGDYAAAAEAWRRLGCPFEEAVALTWTGTVRGSATRGRALRRDRRSAGGRPSESSAG